MREYVKATCLSPKSHLFRIMKVPERHLSRLFAVCLYRENSLPSKGKIIT